MKVVLLCGGKGMRLQERTATLPKPLIEVGNRPILWHVMKWYARFGYREFVLCLGHLGDRIRDYFASDSAAQVAAGLAPWNIAFADTGAETQTGGRIKRVEALVDGDLFLANYSDGLSDLQLNRLIEFHRSHGKLATLTAVRPRSPFGVLDIRDAGVTQFREKPQIQEWINGGFFVFDRRVFSYLGIDSVLESDVLTRLAADGELMAYQHTGRWECMDTYKDTNYLNQLWETGQAFWKVWDDDA